MPGGMRHKRPTDKGGSPRRVKRRKQHAKKEHDYKRTHHSTPVNKPHKPRKPRNRPVHRPQNHKPTHVKTPSKKPVKPKAKYKTTKKTTYIPMPENGAGNSMSSDNYSSRRAVTTIIKKRIKAKTKKKVNH